MSQANQPPRLVAKLRLAGEITALTGMHIGGNDTGLGIGGADKVVVRDPATRRPYIPGSSLKGKMRSLLERVDCATRRCDGFAVKDGRLAPCKCGVCLVCLVFGVPADESRPFEPDRPYAGAARALFRDAHMTEASAAELATWSGLDLPWAEIKTEVSIDRLTSQANPRQFERVPAGTRFGFEVALNVYDKDDELAMLALVQRGLQLVADDAIGGQGSRGYGQVEIRVTRIARRDTATGGEEERLTGPIVLGARNTAAA